MGLRSSTKSQSNEILSSSLCRESLQIVQTAVQHNSVSACVRLYFGTAVLWAKCWCRHANMLAMTMPKSWCVVSAMFTAFNIWVAIPVITLWEPWMSAQKFVPVHLDVKLLLDGWECRHAHGATRKIKLLGFIFWGPWLFEWNFIAVSPMAFKALYAK